MDTLPVETVQHIFELACTDGGATGNALVLVSKEFRAAARKARFHSVSLTATQHSLQAFSALYERECDPVQGDKPRIRHLLVSFSQTLDDTARLPPSHSTRTPIGASGMRKLRLWGTLKKVIRSRSSTSSGSVEGTSTAGRTGEGPPWECFSSMACSCLFPGYASAAQSIFRLAAPDLVTLVMQGASTMCCHPSAFPIINEPLPSLREATFVNVDIRTLFSKQLTSEVAETPIFPALTHLSLSRSGFWGPAPALEFWPAAAPHVTHLSAADAEGWIASLASAVGVRRPNTNVIAIHPNSEYEPLPPSSDEPPPEPTYPSVQHLLLRPSMGPVGACCGNAWMGHAARMRGLGQIERDCQERGVEAFVLMPSKDPTFLRDRYKVARREWLERIEDGSDGAGCWRHLAVLRAGDP